MFIQNTFSFDLSRTFFQFSHTFLFSSNHFHRFFISELLSLIVEVGPQTEEHTALGAVSIATYLTGGGVKGQAGRPTSKEIF